MPEWVAIALGWPLLALGGIRRWRRRLLALVILVAASVTAGLVMGALVPADALLLPRWTGLGAPALQLVLWVTFGLLARAAGGVALPGPPLLTAAIAGAVIGDVAAAGALAAGARDRRGAARLALAAAGGGLIGRIGGPALRLLGGDIGWQLVPVGGLCVLVAVPGGPLPQVTGRTAVTAAAGAVALIAVLLPALLLPALVVGCGVMLALAGPGALRAHRKALVWPLGVVALVILSTAGGVAELTAWGLEELQSLLGAALLPVLTGAGALVAALTDDGGAALLAVAHRDRALSVTVPDVQVALVAGIAVGGLGPLIAADAVRAGLLRWLVQVGIAIAWVGLVVA